MSKIKFMAAAHAGASAEFVYGRWGSLLGKGFELIPLEIAGHGRLVADDFHGSIAEAVESLFLTIKHMVNEQKYVLYGHSMGCLIVYELAKKITEMGLTPPLKIFLSGRNPPYYDYPSSEFYLLPDEQFISEVSAFGGNLTKLFSSPEFREIYLPVLRADYRLIGLYQREEPYPRLESDIVFCYSENDPLVQLGEVEKWRQYTSKGLRIIKFKGDHFFINTDYERICAEIQNSLQPTWKEADDTSLAYR